VYGPDSSVHSITDIDPAEFARIIGENEKYSKFIDSIKNWSENVENQSPVSLTNSGINSEINFLHKVKMELEKVNINLEQFNSQTQIEGIRLAKYEELLKDNSLV
jgi:hypothetical protein